MHPDRRKPPFTNSISPHNARQPHEFKKIFIRFTRRRPDWFGPRHARCTRSEPLQPLRTESQVYTKGIRDESVCRKKPLCREAPLRCQESVRR